MRSTPYQNREEAARVLGETLKEGRLGHPRGWPEGAPPYDLVLGLCRGGVPVAGVISKILHIPMDVMIVRKLPTPGNPELALGAITEQGAEYLNPEVLRWVHQPEQALAVARTHARAEVERRMALYRRGRSPPDLLAKRILIVDDGAATGATVRAAVRAARRAGARLVDVALPVAPPETCAGIEAEADHLICPWRPRHFLSVGGCYEHFPQICDSEVKRHLDEYGLAGKSPPSPLQRV